MRIIRGKEMSFWGADVNTIRSLAAVIRAFMEDDCLCVVGNDNRLKEDKEMFDVLENLY